MFFDLQPRELLAIHTFRLYKRFTLYTRTLPVSTTMPTTMGIAPTAAKFMTDRIPQKDPNHSSIKGFVSKLRGYKPLDSTTTLVNPRDVPAAAADDDAKAHATEEAK